MLSVDTIQKSDSKKANGGRLALLPSPPKKNYFFLGFGVGLIVPTIAVLLFEAQAMPERTRRLLGSALTRGGNLYGRALERVEPSSSQLARLALFVASTRWPII